MGGDIVVALGRATLDGSTLFGHNCCRLGSEALVLHRSAGCNHAPEERIETTGGTVPQVRQTYTAVGVQTGGQWGYHQGFNLCGVALGCTRVRTRIASDSTGLHGPDLVRLALERARTARQAVDLIGDLISRHGQRHDSGADCAFIIADGHEAFVLESAGRFWAYQEIREVRAVSEVCTVRQDWDGIASGLARLAIDNRWWPADGSKIDFAGVVAGSAAEDARTLRRWGRTTLLLEQQNGHIGVPFIRRLLSDHDETSGAGANSPRPNVKTSPLCMHSEAAEDCTTASSLVAELDGKYSGLAWWCPAPPCMGVYLPVLLAGDPGEVYGSMSTGGLGRLRQLVELIGDNRRLWESAREGLGRLQARLDLETDEFLAETGAAARTPAHEQSRQATLFMQHVLECLEQTADGLLRQRPRRATAAVTAVPIHP